MKITITKESIIDGLQKAASIIPVRTGAAYLRSLWLKAEGDTLSIMATDANIEFSGQYDASVSQEGLVGVQGRAFVDLVRQLPGGKITLALDEQSNILLIQQGRRKYKLPANDVNWFKVLSEFPSDNAMRWSGEFLQDLIERVNFCISEEENADALGCMYIKTNYDGLIESCGLNSHQFAMVRFVHEEMAVMLPPEGILIHKKYVQELKRWLSGLKEIDLNISDKRIYLRTIDNREHFSLPRSTYNFPDYMSFVAKLSAENISILNLDRREFIEALGRLAIFTIDNERCTYLDFSETELTMTAQGQDVGSADERIEISYQGLIKKMAFPTRNLMEALSHFTSSHVELRFTAEDGPCGISGIEDKDYTVIIMPMKVEDPSYYEEYA